jgi:hypothetical protein
MPSAAHLSFFGPIELLVQQPRTFLFDDFESFEISHRLMTGNLAICSTPRCRRLINGVFCVYLSGLGQRERLTNIRFDGSDVKWR